MPAPLLLGHRGARNYAPENTLPAFSLALEHGCAGFEFDVRQTADREALLIHDPEIGGIPVAGSTRTQLDLVCNTRIPALEDVFEAFADSAFLNVEVKVTGLEESVLEAVREFPPQAGCVVSSFLPQAIEDLHACDPSLQLGYICDRRNDFSGWPRLPASHIILHYSLLTDAFAEEVHASGRQLWTWTVNDAPTMLRVAPLVDGIISDDTLLLGNTFPKSGPTVR